MLVTMKRPAPGDRQASWLMSWVTGSWKVQLPSKPEPQWRKGAGRHVRCEISAGGDRSGNGHLEEHEVPVIDRFRNEEGPVRHLAGRLGGPAGLRACYEAGPCGFGLRRLLASMGVACDVVAPSLIPRRAGDRVKTGKRGARRRAPLARAGELTAVRVPPAAEEAVRDPVRVRAALLAGRKRAQRRVTAMLLRHGRVCLAATGRWRTSSGSPGSASMSRRWPRRWRFAGRRWIPAGHRSGRSSRR